MQLFVKKVDGKTVVLEADADETMGKFKERVASAEGLPLEELRLLFSGKQLEDAKMLADYRIRDGSTIYSALRLLGGAAERAKREAEEKQYKEDMEKEFSSWFEVADKTEDTGVMRVLVVSMTLEKDREEIHGPADEYKIKDYKGFSSEPEAECYDIENADDGGGDPLGTGYPTQIHYDEEFKKIFDTFGKIFSCMKESKTDVAAEGAAEDGSATRYYELNLDDYLDYYKTELVYQDKSAIDTEEKDKDNKKTIKVRLECARGNEGLWYQGPTKIVTGHFIGGDDVWNFEETCKSIDMWCPAHKCTKAPWRIGGQYKSIERWFFEGVGTTTYINDRGKLRLWSQEDLSGELGLTDGERRKLADKVKLVAKSLLKDEDAQKLDFHEKELEKEVNQFIEEGPCHSPEYGIYQWRVKSLKKLMHHKCVFWTNTEDKLPEGSVLDNHKTPQDPGEDQIVGKGYEVLQFWKYKKKIGIMRKKHVVEDRQRLLDQLEIFTPTYKAVIKRQGMDADDDGGSDHYMVEAYQQTITNIVALALDTHMPDYEEDKIACMIKTMMERRIGPTWHVLVGRSFGFSVQCEARHFLHLYMQHLAVVVWKSEPDPNAGKKRPAIQGQEEGGEAPGGLPTVAAGAEGAAQAPPPNGAAPPPNGAPAPPAAPA